MRSDDDPAPTEQEQDANPDLVDDADAMSGHGHEDPGGAEA